MNIKIIKPTEKYVEQMVKLANETRQYHIEILNGYFRLDAEDAERNTIHQHILNEKEHIVFIAVDQTDNVFGMILGDVLYKPWLADSDIGHIGNLIVSEKTRRQGIGKKLIDAFITECKKRGIQEITLGVYNKNKSAYDFYVKYGFEPFEQKMHIKL